MKDANTTLVPFGDENQITIPDEPVDCSRLGYFDELEEECWELVKKYADQFGIRIVPEEEVSWDVAKDIQELILERFKGAGVKFRFEKNIPPEEIKESYEKRIALIKEKVSQLGAEFEHNFYDETHLDCFWYDGNDIATITYKDHLISFDVCGDISVGVFSDSDEEPFSFRHRGGGEPAYHNSECREIIPDDQALRKLSQDYNISYENNNWISIIVTDLTTNEYVSEPDVAGECNLLEAVENNLEHYIRYIDGLT